MRALRTLPVLILFCLVAATIPALASDGYEKIYSSWTNDGDTIIAENCYVRASIINGSDTIRVLVQSPSYPDRNVTLSEGNSLYYYNGFRIFLVDVDHSLNRALIEVSKPSGYGTSENGSGTSLTCGIPGQLALAGDLVSFPVVIYNNEDKDRTYTLSHQSDTGWNIRFACDGKGVYKVFVPKSSSKTVNLEVQTTVNTSIGEKKVTGKVDDMGIDLYVYITSVNQTLEVTSKVNSKIAAVGDKIYYDIRLKNLQPKESVYGLSVAGLPDNWYYRFKEDVSGTDEMAEVVVPSSEAKNLVLEIVPPYSVDTGDFVFTAIVTSPDGTEVRKDLNLKIKSGVAMSVSSSKLAYDARPGESFNIDLYVANTGKGAALTNVYVESTAPDGWLIQVTPNMTNSIKAGQSQAIRVNVVPPGNIVASDYEVSLKVRSDQAEKEKDFRISIKTESYIPYVGGAIIILVLAGLVFMFRKYGRR